nr:extensin-like [Pelodiscus sinensis]|eukprot:XP_025044081.1 extensin-like [Pelodiscus sinensis]
MELMSLTWGKEGKRSGPEKTAQPRTRVVAPSSAILSEKGKAPQNFFHEARPPPEHSPAIRPPTTLPGAVTAHCPCGTTGTEPSAHCGAPPHLSPCAAHAAQPLPTPCTPCTAASGDGTPVPTGGTESSWSGGTTSIGYRTSMCRRTPSWSSVSDSPLPSGNGTPTCDPTPPFRSVSPLHFGNSPHQIATTPLESSLAWRDRLSWPCLFRW